MSQADLPKAEWSKSSLPSIDHTHRQRRGAAVPAAGPGAGHTATLQQELGQLQRELGSFDITATRRPVNSVQMKDVSSHKFVKILSIPIVALAAGAGCFYL